MNSGDPRGASLPGTHLCKHGTPAFLTNGDAPWKLPGACVMRLGSITVGRRASEPTPNKDSFCPRPPPAPRQTQLCCSCTRQPEVSTASAAPKDSPNWGNAPAAGNWEPSHLGRAEGPTTIIEEDKSSQEQMPKWFPRVVKGWWHYQGCMQTVWSPDRACLTLSRLWG